MQNFVRNSFNVRDQKTLSQLWEAFSGATKKVGESYIGINCTTVVSPAYEKNQGVDTWDEYNCDSCVPSSVQSQASSLPTDHDKTVAGKQMLDAQVKELTKTDSDDTELVPKKKKKRHKETAEPTDTSDTGDPGDIAVMNGIGSTGVEDHVEDEVPKRKKKKRKIEPTADEMDVVEVESDDPPVVKKAKKKKRRREGDEIDDLTDTLAAIEGESGETQAIKKVKKKKQKCKENLGTDDSGQVPGRKRKHEAELDSGADPEGEVILAKKHKRGGGLENGGDRDLELQTIVKKHKHKKEHSLS